MPCRVRVELVLLNRTPGMVFTMNITGNLLPKPMPVDPVL